ncbi:DNA-binding protein [Scytonema hofmannii PCC 7110]|uniref:DNA-binding protein n=1 Tax=Scytonema hofmannii PCC 7110 TaxID=128403 RepID=A0A139WYS2_9CYAN|nr:type II toxin-antitoxin system VapC family toxin [Scytonema hofmannii]KYC37595.1 DNA-binding protein [Scytonema hofmannii PCC 7110]
MNFVLDCSIAMAWGIEDEATEFTDSLLEELAGGSAKVPSIWFLEVANVLAISERRGRSNQAQISQFLGLLGSLPITVDTKTEEKAFTDILNLARTHKLTSYDAAYLELALREGLPLATLDEGLKQVASKLGVTTL